jgi:hypothetical protein
MLEKIFKRYLRSWLENRALRLPSDTVDAISKRLGVPRELVVEVNEAIIKYVTEAIFGK